MMAQRSLNMASGAPKALGLGIQAAWSPNINLSTNMVSEAISQHLIGASLSEPHINVLNASGVCMYSYVIP